MDELKYIQLASDCAQTGLGVPCELTIITDSFRKTIFRFIQLSALSGTWE